MNASDLERLERKIATAKEAKSRAEGAKEQIEAHWKEDFGCKNETEAREKLESLEEKLEKSTKAFDKLVDEIEEEMREAEG